MFSVEMIHRVRQEQLEDRQRQAQHRALIHTIKPGVKLFSRNRLEAQWVQWRLKLRRIAKPFFTLKTKRITTK